MSERLRSRVSLGLFWVTCAMSAVLAVALAIGSAVTFGGGDRGSDPTGLVVIVGIVGASLLGRLIVRRAGNVIGWAFQAMALAAAVGLAADLIILVAADHAPFPGVFGMDLVLRPSPETGEPQQVASGVGSGIRVLGLISSLANLGIALPLPLIFLVFPSGHLLSPRWRWPLRLWAASVIAAVAWTTLRPTGVYGSPPAGSAPGVHIDGPFGIHGIDPVFDVLATAGAVAGLVAGALGVVSLVVRFRRARGAERAQMKWLALVGAAAASTILVSLLSDILVADVALKNLIGSIAFFTLVALLLLGVPLAVAVAILRYRLYDVDLVINKALVYSTLAVFITGVYVALVVGVGSLLGRGDEPNVVLQVAATAVVALAFQPVRERVQRFANRVVYGKRATPYEVLSRFSDRVAGAYATEDVLPRTARILAEATGAAGAAVWIRIGDELRPDGSWPPDAEPPAPVRVEDGELPDLPAARAVPVRYRDELLGALSVTKARGDALRPAEEKLLEDLAQQAGILLSNVRLTAELDARLHDVREQAAELRASRQRVVAAQDEERRRLERNIHDGAQQHLVALAVKLRLARQMAGGDPARARTMLMELRGEVGEALDTLSTLALGIYPPLLEEQGIAAALAAQYTRANLPVHMSIDGAKRYPIEVEAAVYFVCLEALQNAAKHAEASRIEIRLEERDDELRFEVVDDGLGFDPSSAGDGTGVQGMRDRLAVLGGVVEVESAPGQGATIRARVPVPAAKARR